MKDPTIPDPRNRKKFMFYDTEKRQADLRVKLQHDGMTQSTFFRVMITGYLENDEDIINYLNSFQEKYKMRGKHKIKKVRKLIDKGKELKKKFNIDDNDIEDIFDLVEMEGPTL
tara:strand:+ start:3735 stop:4076 length:342 start_codon:yes stop_codon:yes gene_type:complete